MADAPWQSLYRLVSIMNNETASYSNNNSKQQQHACCQIAEAPHSNIK